MDILFSLAGAALFFVILFIVIKIAVREGINESNLGARDMWIKK